MTKQELTAYEAQITLDVIDYLERNVNNSLLPKGQFLVIRKNNKNNEVFFKNKHCGFSLIFIDNELFKSIYIGQIINLKR